MPSWFRRTEPKPEPTPEPEPVNDAPKQADEPAKPREMDRYAFRRQRNLYSDASTYKRSGKPSKLISDEQRRARLHKSFCMFDRNTYSGEGRVTREQMLEIGAYMRSEAGVTEEDNKKMVEAMDENNDGIITFQEFLTFNKDVLYELTDEEFERVDKRFLTIAKETQAARAGQMDPLEDSDWYMFGSENSAIQTLRRQQHQRPTGTTPPRRSGLTEYEKRKLVTHGDLPAYGTRKVGPRRTGYDYHQEDERQNRIWLAETPISRSSDCFTSLPKGVSSREMNTGFDESYSSHRLRHKDNIERCSADWTRTDDTEYHLRHLSAPPAEAQPALEAAPKDPYVYGYRQPHTNFTTKDESAPVYVPIYTDSTADRLTERAWLDAHSRGRVVDYSLRDMARPTRYHGRIEEGPPMPLERWMDVRSGQF